MKNMKSKLFQFYNPPNDLNTKHNWKNILFDLVGAKKCQCSAIWRQKNHPQCFINIINNELTLN